MELGKILVAKIISEDNKDEQFKDNILKAKTFEEILTVENRFLSISSEEISALMFKHWKFNETMIEIMENIKNPEISSESIKKATQILRVVKEAMPITSPLSEKSIQLAIEKAKEYNLNEHTLEETIKSMQTSVHMDENEEDAFFITY